MTAICFIIRSSADKNILKGIILNMIYYLKCFIGIALMFGFGYLPPIGAITETGMQIVGIFLGLIWLWSTVEVIWPSILGIIALGMSDYCSMTDAIKNALGESTIWQLFMVMVLIGGINESGCGAAMGQWILTRKFVRGKPVLFLWFFFVGFMTLSVFIGFLATAMLGWSILYNVMEQAGYKKGDKFYPLATIGVYLAASIGSTVLPFKGVKLSLLKAFSDVANAPIDYIGYMLFTYSTTLLIMTLWVIVMLYVFRVDFSKMKNIDFDQLERDGTKFTTQGKIYMGAFGVIILYILVTSFGPKGVPLIDYLNRITTASIFAVMVVILSVVKYQGEPLISFKKMTKYFEWNGVFICASAIQIASALTKDVCGVIPFITEILNPIFSGFNGYMFIVVVIVIAMILTNVANNMAVGLLLLPIVLSFTATLNLDINLVGIVIVYTVQIAFMLPGASAPAAVLHGNEKLTPIEIYKYGGFAFVMIGIVIVFISYPLFSLIL